jgi:hypothetical protein
MVRVTYAVSLFLIAVSVATTASAQTRCIVAAADPDGVPMAGVRVGLRREGAQPLVAGGQTDVTGGVTLVVPALQEYMLDASLEG